VGAGGQRFVLHAATGGRPAIRVMSGEYHDGTYEPVDEFAPSARELQVYQGEYYSYDAETTLIVALEGGRLVVHRRPDSKATISAVYQDAFDAGQLGLIRFHRDGGGRVVELSVRQGRVYDMRFQRVER
jgi:hypothetical protein